MNITGASGAIPRDDINRMREHAERYYDEIRKRDSDVEAIAKNTGFLIDDIYTIKQHVFFNKYDLGYDELTRFDPDYDMAVSWQRMTEGKNIHEMDIVMLNHELMECRLMSEQGLTYTQAHAMTDKIYSYSKYVIELNRKAGIK